MVPMRASAIPPGRIQNSRVRQQEEYREKKQPTRADRRLLAGGKEYYYPPRFGQVPGAGENLRWNHPVYIRSLPSRQRQPNSQTQVHKVRSGSGLPSQTLSKWSFVV